MPTIDQFQDHPELFDQHTGCCGFAAAWMAMIVKRSPTASELLQCYLFDRVYRGVLKSTRIANRIQKRIDKGLVDSNRHDHLLCFYLMILFKEYAKQKGLGAWDDCVVFSQLWSAWRYSGMTQTVHHSYWFDTTKSVAKLKDLPDDVILGGDLAITSLSYKKGDLAVPIKAMPDLLDLVRLGVKSGRTLIDDIGFRALRGLNGAAARVHFSAFHQQIRGVQAARSAAGVDFDGVILGVGNRPGDRSFETYGNVTHWVYVPTVPVNAPAANDFKIWTWGAEHDFWGWLVTNRGYYPCYAFYLAK